MTLSTTKVGGFLTLDSVREAEATPKAHLVQDLGAESIDSIELMVAFEAEFDIEIPPEEGERIQTVGEAVKYIENKLKEMKRS